MPWLRPVLAELGGREFAKYVTLRFVVGRTTGPLRQGFPVYEDEGGIGFRDEASTSRVPVAGFVAYFDFDDGTTVTGFFAAV